MESPNSYFFLLNFLIYLYLQCFPIFYFPLAELQLNRTYVVCKRYLHLLNSHLHYLILAFKCLKVKNTVIFSHVRLPLSHTIYCTIYKKVFQYEKLGKCMGELIKMTTQKYQTFNSKNLHFQPYKNFSFSCFIRSGGISTFFFQLAAFLCTLQLTGISCPRCPFLFFEIGHAHILH